MEPISPPPRRARSRTAPAVQITDADRALLAFAAEHRFVLAAQVAVLLHVTTAAAEARLRRLGEGGHLRRHKEIHRGPTWHQITRAGLRTIGSDLPAPRGFDLATHRHDAGLGWLVLAARAGRFGPLARRDLRAADALARRPRRGPRAALRGPARRGRGGRARSPALSRPRRGDRQRPPGGLRAGALDQGAGAARADPHRVCRRPADRRGGLPRRARVGGASDRALRGADRHLRDRARAARGHGPERGGARDGENRPAGRRPRQAGRSRPARNRGDERAAAPVQLGRAPLRRPGPVAGGDRLPVGVGRRRAAGGRRGAAGGAGPAARRGPARGRAGRRRRTPARR